MKKLGLCSLFLCLSLCMASDQSPEVSLGWKSRFKLCISTNPAVLNILSSRPMTAFQKSLEKKLESRIFTKKDTGLTKIDSSDIDALFKDLQKKIGIESPLPPLRQGLFPLNALMINASNHILVNDDYISFLASGHENLHESPVMKIALAHEVAHSKYNAVSTTLVGFGSGALCGFYSGYKVAQMVFNSFIPSNKQDGRVTMRDAAYYACVAAAGIYSGKKGYEYGGYAASYINEAVADATAVRIIAQDKDMSCSEKQEVLTHIYPSSGVRPPGYFTREEVLALLGRFQKEQQSDQKK